MSNYRDRQNENQPAQPQVQPQQVYAQPTSANDTNSKLALAGLILGYVFTALTLLAVIGYFALMAAWTSYGY